MYILTFQKWFDLENFALKECGDSKIESLTKFGWFNQMNSSDRNKDSWSGRIFKQALLNYSSFGYLGHKLWIIIKSQWVR